MSQAVILIDDDSAVLASLKLLFRQAGFDAHAFSSGKEYLRVAGSLPKGVLVTDVRMPEMDGLELMRRRSEMGVQDPVVVISGHADVPIAVEAMRLGAYDLVEKPFDPSRLITVVTEAAEQLTQSSDSQFGLTARERQVVDGLVRGQTSKEIARDLGISPRTVEVFRARILKKTGANNTAALVALVAAK